MCFHVNHPCVGYMDAVVSNIQCWMNYCIIKSLWVDQWAPIDNIQHHRIRSALVQVMACCLFDDKSQWLVACSTTSHYLNQCWHIAKWTFRNKLQWNVNQNTNISIKKMHLKMSAAKCLPFHSGPNMSTWHLIPNMEVVHGEASLLGFMPLNSSMDK